MPSNRAAWLTEAKKIPFEVGPAPYTHPSENEIVIKTGAVAINPVDSYQQLMTLFPSHYPTILGLDVAGEVVEIGSSVTQFHVGDRVLAVGLGLGQDRDSECTFQEYVVVKEKLSSSIPSTMSFEAAAVIPLCLSTAACGMYEKEYLALQYPSVSPQSTGQALLVWGGASSVGSCGIQLGVSSGYEVITTAAPKNFDYVKKLGASQVFDYNSKAIVEELVGAFKGKTIAGVLDCITIDGVVENCAEILQKLQSQKMISSARHPPEQLPGGLKAKFIMGVSLKDNEIGDAIFKDYLPNALAQKKFLPAPDPVVVGKGLNAIQDGVEAQKKGVSAKKIVVTVS